MKEKGVETISAYFLSLRRLAEILPQEIFGAMPGVSSMADSRRHGIEALSLVVAIQNALARWWKNTTPPSLGELVLTDAVRPGVRFTHFGEFSGRGTGDSADRFLRGKPLKETPQLEAKLDKLSPGLRLRMQIHPENYTSTSAPYEMSGRHQLLVVGQISEVDGVRLRAQAYAIGHYGGHLFDATVSKEDPFGRLPFRMEMYPSLIDSFGQAKDSAKPTAAQLNRLRNIPESRIKTTFADIVGEPFVPKDWGGEKSDLVTTNVRISGQPVATAFIFKGPAKFKPLTLAELGKNGDQLLRVFNEPVDLIIVQHCHQITQAIREILRLLASRPGQLKMFCLIDGADTVRILSAYAPELLNA